MHHTLQFNARKDSCSFCDLINNSHSNNTASHPVASSSGADGSIELHTPTSGHTHYGTTIHSKRHLCSCSNRTASTYMSRYLADFTAPQPPHGALHVPQGCDPSSSASASPAAVSWTAPASVEVVCWWLPPCPAPPPSVAARHAAYRVWRRTTSGAATPQPAHHTAPHAHPQGQKQNDPTPRPGGWRHRQGQGQGQTPAAVTAAIPGGTGHGSRWQQC